MKVKYHKLQRNAEGELVDAVCDDEGLPIYMLNEVEFNALQTGKKLLPDNVAFIVVEHKPFDMLGMTPEFLTEFITKYTPGYANTPFHSMYKCIFWEPNTSAGKGKNMCLKL